MSRDLECARILVVDDDEAPAGLLRRVLQDEGYSVEYAPDQASALAAIQAQAPDVILLDVILPDANGFDICKSLRRDVVTRLIPIVLVTGLDDRDSRLKGREAGADDFLTKPVDTQELLARVRSLVRLKRYTDDLDSAASILMTLAVMIEARSDRSEAHCHRIANYATSLGRVLGLPPQDLTALHRGGFLHDIGMLAIPDRVLLKTGPLTPAEFQTIKMHPQIGDRLCGQLRSLQSVRPIVRHHHERLDGSGYPDGLGGDEVPLLAQVIGLVDVYDTVTNPRPYQRAQSVEHAFEILRQEVNRGWRQRELVETFIHLVQSGSFQTFTAGTVAASI